LKRLEAYAVFATATRAINGCPKPFIGVRIDRRLRGRTQMPTLAVQLTIGDYAKWRPVFDKHRPLRDKAGFTNVHIYRNADDAREVIIWGETSDVAKAREALAGQEIKDAMKEAGVVGPPKVHVIA
jgi:erythromycin esterase-like protein